MCCRRLGRCSVITFREVVIRISGSDGLVLLNLPLEAVEDYEQICTHTHTAGKQLNGHSAVTL